MSLFSLTYLSSAIPELNKSELLLMLKEGRRRNETAGITGILIYRDGDILQVLEGEESAVRDTFQRISADRRHARIFVAIQEPIAERQFHEWTMAFRDLSLHPSMLEGFNDLLNCRHPENELHMPASKIRIFLRSFVRRASPTLALAA